MPGRLRIRGAQSVILLLLGLAGAPSFAQYPSDAAAVRAQEADPIAVPFNSLRFGLSGGMVFRDRGMTEWSPGPDARLTIDTPYGRGRLRMDVAWRPWTGSAGVEGVIDPEGGRSTEDLPDVQTVAVLAGWGWSSAPVSVVSLEAGLLLGNLFMLFDLSKGTAGRFESEILVGPWIRISRLAGPIRLFGEVRAHRVVTHPRWDVICLSAGISMQTPTPDWIQWMLR